jgi:hypothetical protein
MTTAGAARMFTQPDAEALAAVTHDGTGLPFKAVHIIDALKRQIASDRRMLGELGANETTRAPALVKEDDDL